MSMAVLFNLFRIKRHPKFKYLQNKPRIHKNAATKKDGWNVRLNMMDGCAIHYFSMIMINHGSCRGQ